METIGIVNMTGELSEEYIEMLKKEDYQIVPIEPEANLNTGSKKIDGVIIFDEEQKNVGETCNLILKIKDASIPFVWTFSREIPEVNRLVYLQLGATGNFHKDCEPEELRLIIRNTMMTRQFHSTVDQKKHESSIGNESDLGLLSDNRSVLIGTKEIGLTKLEYKLLEMLFVRNGRAATYEEIHAEIWGKKQKFSRARIANLMFHLRQKMEIDPLYPKYVRTVRSKGYMLDLWNSSEK
ncbi:response regulator transcription factor [Enterococcus sp. BWM-S5]|uniref:Response regulator transcription factor n=1 Tax=Enterococcus larvae TaxID=2794352 RepID=A0ABS4CIA0_9ENTE|nr:winged helix-turn-helix domain-containing protein [Enterococcus larvae]MBP1046189.1 response regulator transcription factor [Enterococcus larvae]